MRPFMTKWLAFASLLLAASAGWTCSHRDAPGAVPQRKNVLLITLDGLRQDHLSAFGYARPTSPQIDWLAQHGLVYRTIVPSSCSTKAKKPMSFATVTSISFSLLSRKPSRI